MERKPTRKRKQTPTKIVPKLFKTTCNRFLKSFYNVPCKELAVNLLGKILIRKLDDGSILKGRIVETESYLGGIDKASYSYNGRRTERCEPMYMEPGTCFVYLTYGMYHCFNISSAEPGAAVLLRALEPVVNLEKMKELRFAKIKTPNNYKPKMLCNGPSKLCKSMTIEKDNCNKLNLGDINNDALWIEDDAEYKTEAHKIINTSRIGIESAGSEWANMPLRYYIFGNECVSKLDKNAEKSHLENVNDNE